MSDNHAIPNEEVATEGPVRRLTPGDDHRLARTALDELVGGIVAAAGATAYRSPLLWKALLLRAMVVNDLGRCDIRSLIRLGVLGRELLNPGNVGVGLVGPSECDEPCVPVAVEERLARVEKAMASIESKLDCLLVRVGVPVPGSDAGEGCRDLMASVGDLRELVGRSLRDTDRIRKDNAYKEQVIDEMSEGADTFLSGLVGRIGTQAERELFFLLIHREDVGGAKRPLTYEQIGKRLGGTTKQAAHAKAMDFRHKYRDAWEYVISIRRPGRAANFSELSPSDRRKHGVDKTYDHEPG